MKKKNKKTKNLKTKKQENIHPVKFGRSPTREAGFNRVKTRKQEMKKIEKQIVSKKTEAIEKKEKKTNGQHLLRGMKDILPDEQYFYQYFLQKAENIAQAYGFQKIDTPILEETSLFVRGVGKETEVVEKQIFSFADKNGEQICLRPENTAPVVRAYIEHGMITQPQPVKLYYFAPQFRYEKPQAGRQRQFYSFGLEVIGDKNPIIDAQIVSLIYFLFKDLELNINIQINSIGCLACRKEYKKYLLNFYRSKKRFLCEDCQNRLIKNPLRLLDCKNEECQKIVEEAPQIVDYLCADCKDHFIKVLEYLDELEIPYNLNPRIVRGLDYYTRTVFEIWAEEDLKGQNALGGGGRYDNLIETLGGRPAPACGVGLGVERVINILNEKKLIPLKKREFEVFLAQIGLVARKKCLKLFEELRKNRIKVAEALSKDDLRSQLESANRLGVKMCLILGQNELLEGTILIRDMESGAQETVNCENIVEEVRKRLKAQVKKIKI